MRRKSFVVGSKADELLHALGRNRALVLKEYQIRQLERAIFVQLGEPGRPGEIDRRWVGQNANKILAEIGITAEEESAIAGG